MSLEQLNTTEFTSRTSARRPSRRIVAARTSQGAKKRRSGGSALLGVCTLMLCCALLLSVAFMEEPFVATMTGSDGHSVTDDILGRLVYLCEQFAGVFLPNHELDPPVKGEVVATFQSTGEWVEFFGYAGCDVYACADGVVTQVVFGDDGGRVELTLENGAVAIYTCLGEPVVEVNQPVSAGDALAVSPSGRVMFSYQRLGVAEDPLPLMGLSSK
ncbi:MAG: M23 family metallopeptidase [Christensenellales bacterium]|jgi:murein DD-endopeptidase MepM/ murein hydrolase activator NlpD